MNSHTRPKFRPIYPRSELLLDGKPWSSVAKPVYTPEDAIPHVPTIPAHPFMGLLGDGYRVRVRVLHQRSDRVLVVRVDADDADYEKPRLVDAGRLSAW